MYATSKVSRGLQAFGVCSRKSDYAQNLYAETFLALRSPYNKRRTLKCAATNAEKQVAQTATTSRNSSSEARAKPPKHANCILRQRKMLSEHFENQSQPIPCKAGMPNA